MSWFVLSLAGLLEIVWALGLKTHNGQPAMILGTAVSAVLSVILLGIAVKQIPISTAYAVWTGIGIVGTAAFGVFRLGEPMSSFKMLWLLVTLLGITGLKLTSE